MAKSNKNSKKGLGRGLDSLIPKIENNEEKNNPSVTLKDILSNSEDEEMKAAKKDKEIVEESEEKNLQTIEKKIEKIEDNAKELINERGIENEIKKSKEKIKEVVVLSDYELASIKEVKQIIEKNPRITLWSAKSSAVFRYLRKTRPEFSISKEASKLIDESVSKRYPEIWKLFEDL